MLRYLQVNFIVLGFLNYLFVTIIKYLKSSVRLVGLGRQVFILEIKGSNPLPMTGPTVVA